MKKIIVVFGTRPEAIKMIPLIKALQAEKQINVKVCVTAQHRQMLDQVLNLFEIKPDYDLNIMKSNQDLYDISSKVLLGLRDVFYDYRPDLVLVHGDTTTASMASLAAFYQKIKIGHIEAGLRTNNIYSPFPEEANRQIISILANYHFAPTVLAKENLISENKIEKNISVTGNTAIDTLFLVLEKINKDKFFKERIIDNIKKVYKCLDCDHKFILVTGHRRENLGKGFINIFDAIKDVACKNPDIDIVFPVHLNPQIQNQVNNILLNIKNVYLIPPVEYSEFVFLMNKSYFIITDSGGIQEEALSLGKPILVTRDITERLEAIASGTAKLVGINKNTIIEESQKLIYDKIEYNKMNKASNIYGDGRASERIVKFLKESW